MTARPVALITGSSSGMGKDLALRLIAEGYQVYGAARRPMPWLGAAGGEALALDVTDDAALVAAVDRIIAARGRIDVLVNAAGYGQYGAVEDVPMDLARRQFEVNVLGAARLSQLVLPHMRARRAGRIVMYSSVGGKIFTPLGGWYTASKFALEGLSDSLRNEVRPFGISVILIEPGAIDTEFGLSMASLRQISGQGAYAPLVAAFERMIANVGTMSPPSVITDVVMKALKARRPRARYHGGRLSGLILFLRHWLPDGLFDRLVMSNFRTR